MQYSAPAQSMLHDMAGTEADLAEVCNAAQRNVQRCDRVPLNPQEFHLCSRGGPTRAASPGLPLDGATQSVGELAPPHRRQHTGGEANGLPASL